MNHLHKKLLQGILIILFSTGAARGLDIEMNKCQRAYFSNYKITDTKLCEALEIMRREIQSKIEDDHMIIFEYQFRPEKSFRTISVNLTKVYGLQALTEIGKQAKVQVSVGTDPYRVFFKDEESSDQSKAVGSAR